MSATHHGFFNTSGTRTHVRFSFTTHEATGGNVAPSSAFEAADLRIYKAADGAALSATQRASASGVTMTSPFDSLTGTHAVDIDLTDDADAGFYASGCYYEVWLSPDETIDGQTITGVPLACFEVGVAEANVTQAAGTAWNSGAITEASFATTAGSFAPLGIIDQGTAQSATSTGLVLRAGASFADNVLRNCVVAVYGSTQGYWQAPRLITANALSGDTVTVDPAWEVTPSGTIDYKIYGAPADLTTPPAVNVTQLGGSATPVTNLTTVFSTDFANNYNTTDDAWAVKIKGNISHGGSGTTVDFPTFQTTITGNLTGSVGSVAGNVGGSVNSVATTVAANVVSVSGDTTAADNLEAALDGTGGVTITAGLTGNVTGNLSGSVGSVTGAVGSVTGNVGGTVTGSVGSVTSAVTITGDAATAGTRLLTMLELDGSVYRYTVNSLEQGPGGGGSGSFPGTADEWSALKAILGVPNAGTTPEDPTAGILDTIRDAVATVDDFLDTEVAAIKAKTDQLTFTETNQVDANTKSINDTAVQGVGTSGNKWRG
jgi:hypothetical protein